jgi:hypothetical protein
MKKQQQRYNNQTATRLQPDRTQTPTKQRHCSNQTRTRHLSVEEQVYKQRDTQADSDASSDSTVTTQQRPEQNKLSPNNSRGNLERTTQTTRDQTKTRLLYFLDAQQQGHTDKARKGTNMHRRRCSSN